MPVTKAIHISASIDIDDVAQPGAFQFQDMSYRPIDDPSLIADGEAVRIAFFDPAGRRGDLVVTKNVDGPCLKWDGGVYLPTITPVICNTHPAGDWRGFLTKGQFVPC
jgi:hypothetical protein